MFWLRINVSLVYLTCLLITFSQPAAAQSSGILVVDLERAYKTSRFGESMRDAFNSENQSFNEENKVILNRLKDEEIQLTADRTNLSQEEFAVAADAFDMKVQEIRKTRLEKIRLVEESFNLLKPMFFRRVDSFFDELMLEFNATAILEKNSVVRSNDAIDITNLLVERVDQAFLVDQNIKETDRQD